MPRGSEAGPKPSHGSAPPLSRAASAAFAVRVERDHLIAHQGAEPHAHVLFIILLSATVKVAPEGSILMVALPVLVQVLSVA